jgi:hypothetical protein
MGNCFPGLLMVFCLVILQGLAALHYRLPEILEEGENELPDLHRPTLRPLRLHILSRDLDTESNLCPGSPSHSSRTDSPSSRRSPRARIHRRPGDSVVIEKLNVLKRLISPERLANRGKSMGKAEDRQRIQIDNPS